MSFSVKVVKLNAANPYRFTNRNLLRGILCRENMRTGEKTYYTSNYRKFSQYSHAKITQRLLNNNP